MCKAHLVVLAILYVGRELCWLCFLGLLRYLHGLRLVVAFIQFSSLIDIPYTPLSFGIHITALRERLNGLTTFGK